MITGLNQCFGRELQDPDTETNFRLRAFSLLLKTLFPIPQAYGLVKRRERAIGLEIRYC